MKTPAVAIAAAFAGGIVLGRSALVAARAAQHSFLLPIAAGLGALLLVAIFLSWRDRLWLAASTSLLSWLGLGMLASCLAQQPLPPEHILSRVAAQQVPLRTPLRWTGILREEPSRLPWGYSLEVNLENVETAAGTLPISGGMRIGFTPRDGEPALPLLHAGDRVSIFAEAHQPLVYKDPGAFDRRDFLARQGIHLLATMRSTKLLEKSGECPEGWKWRIARVRGFLRDQTDAIFAGQPGTAAVLRAMLLGDRSFVDRAESVDFQKTGTFHVLVVAGLHVGALAAFLYWLSRRLHLGRSAEAFLIIAVLFCYVMVVEQRTPVLRAGLTAVIVLLGSLFCRRLDLLNSAALAALILLLVDPMYLSDSGFLLSFMAIGCIAGIAMPVVDRSVDPFVRAMRSWRDVTRDASHAPKMVQFRLDFRDAVALLTSPFRGRLAKVVEVCSANGVRLGLRVAELFVVSFVLQFGMMALMARDFHRVSLLGPVVNLVAVPLTGVIVPLGFAGLLLGSLFRTAARVIALPLAWLVFLQHRTVSFFADIPHTSYRIPGPPVWLTALFFLGLVVAVIALRNENKFRDWQWGTLTLFVMCVAVAIAVYPFPPTVISNELEGKRSRCGSRRLDSGGFSKRQHVADRMASAPSYCRATRRSRWNTPCWRKTLRNFCMPMF